MWVCRGSGEGIRMIKRNLNDRSLDEFVFSQNRVAVDIPMVPTLASPILPK